MNSFNYYLHKDSKTGEIVYLEYNKIDGYPVTPKTKITDAISVNKIVFVNPDLREKLIRKKVEIKIRYLLRILDQLDDDSDEGVIKNTLLQAEKLRIDIINKYMKYLGNTYGELSMKKIQIVTTQLRMKLFDNINRRNNSYINELYYLEEDEPKRGRGR